MELAPNDGNDQKNEDGNNGNSNHPIRSHPKRPKLASSKLTPHQQPHRGSVPTSHAPQSLDTGIHISLTLLQIIPRVLDRLPLSIQISQHVAPNILRLQRNPLTLLQPRRAALQSLRAGQKLLPLFQVLVLWLVCVSVSEEGFPVVGE